MDFLQRAKAERDRLLKKLAALDEAIAILDPVYGENWEDNVPEWALGAAELGLTDTIRRLLRDSYSALSPIDVRDRLVKAGYDFGVQPNPLASIHTTLKRITNGSDPLYVREDGEKGTLYKFNGIHGPHSQAAHDIAAGRYRGGKLTGPDPIKK